jgi:hypothetical protein
MLNQSGESRHPCLVPNFSGNGFSCFPFSMMLAIGLLLTNYFCLKKRKEKAAKTSCPLHFCYLLTHTLSVLSMQLPAEQKLL